MKAKNIKCKNCNKSKKLMLDKQPTILQQQEIQRFINQGHSVVIVDFMTAKNLEKCTCSKK